MEHPLADRIRPQSLDEVVGQKHLLGGNALLRRFIEKGTDANMVFYGPSGTGKTTIANIIAKRTQRHHRLPSGREGHYRGRGHADGPRRRAAVSG